MTDKWAGVAVLAAGLIWLGLVVGFAVAGSMWLFLSCITLPWLAPIAIDFADVILAKRRVAAT